MDVGIGTRVLVFVGSRMGAGFDGVRKACGKLREIKGLVGCICVLRVYTRLVSIISRNIGVFVVAILGSLGIVD